MLNSVVVCFSICDSNFLHFTDFFLNDASLESNEVIYIVNHDISKEKEDKLLNLLKKHSVNHINVQGYSTLKKGNLYTCSLNHKYTYKKGVLQPQEEGLCDFFSLPLSLVKSCGKLIVVPFWECDYKDIKKLNLLKSFGGEIWFESTSGNIIPTELKNLLNENDFEAQLTKAVQENSKSHKESNQFIDTIIHEIKNITKHDFSLYKKNTINRRIERRIQATKLNNLKEYTQFLKNNEKEVKTLHDSLLINVTEFYRDPETFQYIEENIIPRVVNNSKSNELKVWVVGCASGEEAYTWCILIKEYLNKNKIGKLLKIFASDIDITSLSEARKGAYPPTAVQNIPKYLLDNYFTFDEGLYHITPEIRKHVVFAEHDLTQDAPYSRLDLVSCRNVLIYLEKELQNIAFSIFHYSLIENGYLTLGNTESFSATNTQFKTIDRKFKVFQKLYNPDASRKFIHHMKFNGGSRRASDESFQVPFQDQVKNILIEKYTPPSVVVNSLNEVIYFQGKMGDYLGFSGGIVKNDLLKICKDSIKADLSELLIRARQTDEEIRKEKILIPDEDQYREINIYITPLTQIDHSDLLLISFQTSASYPKNQPVPIKGSSENDHISLLENELSNTREYLQKTIDDLEVSNEYLETSNEELKSTIEELQSINEELDTSKEEYEIINEELKSVNKSLEEKIQELTELNGLVNNLMSSINMPILFLNMDLTIYKFTPSVSEIYNLLPADHGRPLKSFKSNLKTDNIIETINLSLQSRQTLEKEVMMNNDMVYWMKVQPLFTLNSEFSGIALVFTDITTIKKQENELLKYRDNLETLVKEQTEEIHNKGRLLQITTDNFPEGFISLISMSLQVLYSGGNNPFKNIKHSPNSAFPLQALISEGAYKEMIRQLPELYMANSVKFEYQEGEKALEFTCKPLDENGNVNSFIMVCRDITEQKHIIEDNLKNLAILDKSINEIYIINGKTLKFEYVNEGTVKNTGYSYSELYNMAPYDIKPEYSKGKFLELVAPLQEGKVTTVELTTKHKRKNGTTYPVEIYLQNVTEGQEIKYLAIVIDISEKRKNAKLRQESEDMVSSIANSIPGLVMKYIKEQNNHERIDFISNGISEMWGVEPSEIINQPDLFWMKIDTQHIKDLKQKINQSAKSLESWKHTFRVIPDSGRQKWVFMKGIPKKEKHNAVSWNTIALDITPQKEMEEELLKTKSLLDYASSLSNVGGWEIDLENNHIEWSAETNKIFDLSSSSSITLKEIIKMFTDKEKKVKIMDYFRKAKHVNDTFEDIVEVKTLSNKTKWVKIICKPDQGAHKKIHGAVIDISEQKRKEDNLKLQEKVIQNTKDSVLITEGHGPKSKVIFVNESFISTTGYKFNDIINGQINILYGPDSNKNILKKINNAIELGKLYQTEVKLYKRNGDSFWANQFVAPIISPSGKLCQVIYIIQDINDKKTQEIERERIIGDLEKLNKEMDNFIYRVSHDLRAPISSAIGLINISQKEENIDNIKSYLDVQKNSLFKLDKFIQDILNYSRNTRLSIQSNKIDMKDLILENVDQLVYEPEKRKRITVSVKNEYLYYGDELRLNIILNNLISNAIKFTLDTEREPKIKIYAKVNKTELKLEISDNGIGIEQKYINKIYDMFFRATVSNHGSGLGLYIVKDAVDLLNGKIEVDSKFNEGTKFTLHIPNRI